MKPKPSPHESISALLQVISPEARLRILLAIGRGEACVCHLEALLGQRQAYISQHLMALRQAGLITSRRDGKYIYHRLSDPGLLEVIRAAARLCADPESDLAIQEHTDCECPRCSASEMLISPDLPLRLPVRKTGGRA